MPILDQAFYVVINLARLAHGVSREASTVCKTLDSMLPGKIFFLTDGTYSSSSQSYFFTEARLHPACITLPSRSTDVATIVHMLTENGDQSPPFAIRSGSNSAHARAVDVQGGVTIDLRHPNATIMRFIHFWEISY